MMGNKGVAARVIAVTSGKGGVGKSNTSVNLAIALAAQGKRVILMDADLGLANVEVLLGLSSLHNLEHVIEGEKTIADILVKGPGGISVVPGSSGMAKIADLTHAGRQNLLGGLQDLQAQSDFIILDTMAGIGRNAVAFSLAADEVILITTPEHPAIVDAYAMLKTLYANQPDTVVRLVVNMVPNPALAQAVYTKMSGVSQRYLGKNLSFLGYLARDPHVSQAVMQSKPFMIAYPHAPVSQCMNQIASRLLQHQVPKENQKEGFFKRFAQTFGLAGNG
jgi:flagellar biosynthesis protein FlhG